MRWASFNIVSANLSVLAGDAFASGPSYLRVEPDGTFPALDVLVESELWRP